MAAASRAGPRMICQALPPACEPTSPSRRFSRLWGKSPVGHASTNLNRSTTLIHVIATIELHSGKREAFLSEFSRIVRQVRAEDGCIEYGATIDLASGLPAQVPMRPDSVTVVEKWSNLEALSAHLGAPHMKAYRECIKAFVIRTTLQVLAPAGEPTR